MQWKPEFNVEDVPTSFGWKAFSEISNSREFEF